VTPFKLHKKGEVLNQKRAIALAKAKKSGVGCRGRPKTTTQMKSVMKNAPSKGEVKMNMKKMKMSMRVETNTVKALKKKAKTDKAGDPEEPTGETRSQKEWRRL